MSKKMYLQPEMEEILIKANIALLAGSIKEDGEAETGNGDDGDF